MSAKLSNVALVTGGSSGIGAAISAALQDAGWRIAIADKKIPCDQAACNVQVSPCDLTCEADVKRLFSELDDADCPPSAIVHCAGIYPGTPFEDVDFQLWRTVMSTNLDSFFLVAKYGLPFMRSSRYGRVVAFTSNTFFDATAGLSAYIASKAGLIGLVRALSREYGADGVTVNAIAPSITRTATTELMFDADGFEELVAKQSIPKLAEPRDYVGTVEFLLSNDSSFLTGQTLVVDGGWTHV